MSRALLSASLLLACVNAQKCITGIDFTVDSGLCSGYRFRGSACFPDKADTKDTVAFKCKLTFTIFDQTFCDDYFKTVCADVGGISKSGNCNKGKNSRGCITYFRSLQTDLDRGACTVDDECSASAVAFDQPAISIYKKGVPKLCCSGIPNLLSDLCDGINTAMMNEAIAGYKRLGQCLDETLHRDCYSSSSLVTASLFPLLAATAISLLFAIC